MEARDYFFLSDEEFTRRERAGEFAESAEVHGRRYGTLRREVERVLAAGRHVVMAIDVQGARQFRAAFPVSVLVFVLPPSVEVLAARLRARNTESEELIERRLRTALQEIEAVQEYDYVVINDELEVAAAQVSAIIDAEMARAGRVRGIEQTVATLVADLRRVISAKK